MLFWLAEEQLQAFKSADHGKESPARTMAPPNNVNQLQRTSIHSLTNGQKVAATNDHPTSPVTNQVDLVEPGKLSDTKSYAERLHKISPTASKRDNADTVEVEEDAAGSNGKSRCLKLSKAGKRERCRYTEVMRFLQRM